jgi:hypothetical protein
MLFDSDEEGLNRGQQWFTTKTTRPLIDAPLSTVQSTYLERLERQSRFSKPHFSAEIQYWGWGEGVHWEVTRCAGGRVIM